jgi:hypothetical protein
VVQKGLSNNFQTMHSLVLGSSTQPPSWQYGATYVGTNKVSENEVGTCWWCGVREDPAGGVGSGRVLLVVWGQGGSCWWRGVREGPAGGVESGRVLLVPWVREGPAGGIGSCWCGGGVSGWVGVCVEEGGNCWRSRQGGWPVCSVGSPGQLIDCIFPCRDDLS